MADRRTLILMRHATAGHQGATRDHDRPLTEHGRQQAADAGRWIRASLPTVDAVLCSTATRTRQTFAAAGIQAPVSYQDELYGGGLDDILELLCRLPADAATALVIGHAPGIPAAAASLAEIAREAAADDGSAADADADADVPSDDDAWAPPGAARAALRMFPAAAIAVLGTAAQWDGIAATGADLVTVRLPEH